MRLNTIKGQPLQGGYFVVNDEMCLAVTRQVGPEHPQASQRDSPSGKRTIVPMGAVWPQDGPQAIGLVYEDVDVTNGPMPCSVVVRCKAYVDRLPLYPSAESVRSMVGISFSVAPEVERPYDEDLVAWLTMYDIEQTFTGETIEGDMTDEEMDDVFSDDEDEDGGVLTDEDMDDIFEE